MDFTEVKDPKLHLLVKSTYRHHDCESVDLIPYTCDRCNFKTPLKVQWFLHTATHYQNHHPQPPVKVYRCEWCDFHTFSVLILSGHVFHRCQGRRPLFECSHKLWKHIHTMHTSFEWFQCDHCTYVSSKRRNLKLHTMRMHHTTNPSKFKWNIVPKVTKTLSCDQCPYKTANSANYKRHVMAKHTDLMAVKWFECDHCGFKTKEKAILKKHIMVKHMAPEERRWFECDHCAYRAPVMYSLRTHMLRRHADKVDSFKCGVCSFRAPDPGKLTKHVQNKHQEGSGRVSRSVRRVRPKNVLCDQCSYATTHITNLKRHMMAKHPHLITVRWFECDHCEFKTKEKANLKKHVVAKHTNVEEIVWFKCEHCVFKSKSNTSLKKHVLVKHTDPGDIKWFECEVCPHKAKTRTLLNYHMKSKHTLCEDAR